MKRLITALAMLTLSTTLSAQTYRYDYPSTYACGGTIRARVTSATTSAISFEVQKSTDCVTSLFFKPPNGEGEAQVRADTSNGPILGRAKYKTDDPRVIVTIPSFTSGSRTYYASIDAYRAGPITVTVTPMTSGQPDLIVSWEEPVPANPAPNGTVTLRGQVMNIGAGSAAASTAQFAYSTSAVLTASNTTRLGNAMSVGSLARGASSPAMTTTWTIPAALANTTIYVALLADSTNALGESNEQNNFYSPAMMMRVGAPPPLQEVLIGPVAWIHVRKADNTFRLMTETEMSAMIDTVIAEIGAGQTMLEGNGRRVRLLLSVEIPWNESQPLRGTAPNFAPWVTLARLCEQKKVRLAIQFSVHNLPEWVRQDYAGDAMKGEFLPLRPTSTAWAPNGPAANWIRAGITALHTDRGVSRFGAIDTVITGNEMQYPAPAANATDAARRALELARMLATFMTAAREQLDAYGLRQNITTKLYSYYFPPHRAEDSSYSPDSLKVIHNAMRGVTGFDSYGKAAPNSGTVCTSYDWTATQDIEASKRYAQGLPMYMAEFDHDRKACPSGMSANTIAATIAYGISRGVTRYSFFAWNPRDTTRQMGPEQKNGMKRAFYATVGR